jgi:hypothetical protein
MGKKKLLSTESVLKLSEAVLGNVAGRLGGLTTLDRDIQLQLLSFAEGKGKYWYNKFSPYHQLNEYVSDKAVSYGVPKDLRGLAMAYARAIARCYAKYGDTVAEECARSFADRLTEVVGNADFTTEVYDTAAATGKAMRGMYALAPP